MEVAEPRLRLDGVSKSFGAIRATDDVSLAFADNRIHALIGPNGAGKSTLIQQIAGWLRPDAGRIVFGGEDITALSVAGRVKKGLARTFQVSSLVQDFTVLGNVRLAIMARQGSCYRFWKPVKHDSVFIQQSMAVLARVGLDARAKVLTRALSHGERRQLELACALALEPKVLLLDEPMAGLGLDGSKRMTGLLDSLRDEVSIVLVEHDMDAVFALADDISVLVYGGVVATGSPDVIRTSRVVRGAYLGGEG